MPITLTRNDTARRIVATGGGEFRAADVLQVFAGLRESDAWTYGIILDLRQMTGAAQVADLKPIKDITGPVGSPGLTRGPLAILALGPSLYGIACACAALFGPSSRVAVFRDRTEAEQWLASQMA